MRRGERILIIVIGVELVAGGAALAWRASQPLPPLPNLQQLDSLTAAELRELRTAARGRSPERWRELAEAYLAHGYFPEAEATFRQAAQWQPDSFYVLYGWAFCLERLGRTTEAIGLFEQAALLADEDLALTSAYHIARCHLREGGVAQAEDVFRRSAEFPPAKFQLAKILIRSGREAEALPLLEELRRVAPGTIEPILLQARAELQVGRTQAASDLLDLSERTEGRLPLDDIRDFLDPIRFRFGLARQVYECQRLRESAGVQAGADCFGPLARHNDYWYARRLNPMLAQLEIERDRPGEALRLLTELFEHSNTTPETLQLMGDAQFLLQRRAEAVELWERAGRMRESAAIHGRLAEHYRQAGDEPASRRHQAGTLHCGGVAAFRRNALDSAAGLLRQAVDLNPDRDHTWFYLGETHRARGQRTQAADCYRRCLELNPAHGRAAAALRRISAANA